MADDTAGRGGVECNPSRATVAGVQRSKALLAAPSLQALVRPGGPLRWLAAVLVAVLLAGVFDAATDSAQHVRAALASGAEIAPQDERQDVARPETELRTVKPASKAAPDPAPDENLAAVPRSARANSFALGGPRDTRHHDGPSARPHRVAQPRAPPLPASIG